MSNEVISTITCDILPKPINVSVMTVFSYWTKKFENHKKKLYLSI